MTKRSDFRKALNDVLRLANSNETLALRDIRRVLRELRASIADRVTRGAITAATVSRLLSDVNAMIEQSTIEIADISRNAVITAGGYGADSVLSPLDAISAPVFTLAQTQRIGQLAGFTVDLIVGGLSDSMRNRIRRAIRLNALGDSSPGDAMADIDTVLGLVRRGGRAASSGVFYDAERIVRTETGRAFNMAANDTLLEAAEDDPNVKKRWVNPLQPTSRPSHVAAHMQTLSKPIPVDEPFIVGGEALMFPQDPNGSAGNTINCGCRTLTVYDDLGVIQMPQEAARLNQAMGR